MLPASSRLFRSRSRSARTPSAAGGVPPRRTRWVFAERLESRTLLSVTFDPPAGLTNLTATSFQEVPSIPDSIVLKVQWQDVSDNETGFRVDTYNSAPNLPGSTPTNHVIVGANATSATLPLAPYAVVHAFNADGRSPFKVAELNRFQWPDELLTGTPIGTPGSWNNTGNTLDKALDNDPTTFFDAPTSQAWVGLDLGSLHTISGFSFVPRANQPARMIGGQLQGSDDASAWTTLATISGPPAVGTFTPLGSDSPRAFRYVRYLSPDGGFGNVAELDFTGTPIARPFAPTNLSVGSDGFRVTATWTDNATNETGYRVSLAGAAPWGTHTKDLPANATSTFFDVNAPGTYTFSVHAFNDAGLSLGQSTTVTVVPYPNTPTGLLVRLNPSGGTALSWQDNSSVETGFDVFRRVGDTGNFLLLNNVGPNVTQYNDTTATAPGTTYYYFVTATGPTGISSPASNTVHVTLPAVQTPLTGTPFGSPGSWNDSGATFDKALDKNVTTFFDAPTPDNNFVGLHLAQPTSITHFRVYPRDARADRMYGGKFQGSTDGSTWVDLATLDRAPAQGTYTTIPSANKAFFTHVRYLAPVGSHGNVAEVEFYGNPVTITPNRLVGTPIGTPGSWQNSGATFDKALDNDIATFFDAPTANDNYTGYDLGTPYALSHVRFVPRTGQAARMVGGRIEGSNDGFFWVNLATVRDLPPEGVYTTLNVDGVGAYRYLRYLSPDGGFGNVAEVEFYGTAATGQVRLTGAGFGTAGSWNDLGNTFAKALDNDLTTFFDAPTPQAHVGIDTAGSYRVELIRFAPRFNQPGRMVGGKFQGSTNGSTWVDLYTVTAAPTAGVYTTVAPTLPGGAGAYRYLRYLSPDGGFGNVAEVEFYGRSTA